MTVNEAYDIGWAVEQMRRGERVRRAGWNGKGMFLQLDRGDASGMTGRRLPYVEMRTVQGHYVPWLCSQTDLLASDWELVDR